MLCSHRLNLFSLGIKLELFKLLRMEALTLRFEVKISLFLEFK